MSNHLQELCEFYETKGMNYLGHHTNHAIDNARVALSFAKNSICFDIGEFGNFSGFSYTPGSAIDLPFEHCWFEARSKKKPFLIGVLMSKIETESGVFLYQASAFTRVMNEWSYSHSFTSETIDCEQIRIYDCSSINTELLTEFRHLVLIYLSALNCKNVEKVERKPDAKLQKARAKRGKKPLFSYWTLELTDQKTESGATCGGTHASPRLHLRRGHPRQFKPGHWTWVQPCAVGNKKLGMVHKDYSFTPSNDTLH